MSFLRFFRATRSNPEDGQRALDCLQAITCAVSQYTGIPKFLQYDANTVAFSGSKDKMELVLTVYIQRTDGKNYLCATIDDQVTWNEWDFENQAEFQNEIIQYLSNRVNQTIKTVIEKVRHQSYRETIYCWDENTKEWVLVEDNSTENPLVCRIASRKTETTETIKTYCLDMR